ncbi:MAG TPA: hypothetical protein VG940_07555 [Gemmatimonadales bacterium]|nr:hypothetical protein [Gemmatimonadales bacterium]
MTFREYRPAVLLTLLLSSLAACESDGSASDDTPDFTIAADTAAPTTLGTASDVDVTLRSTGYAGPVTLAVLGLPASWSAALSDTTVDLPAGDSVTVSLTVTVPSNGAAAAGGQSFSVQATGGALQHSAGTRLTVADEFVIHVLAGASAGAHWSATAHGPHLNVGTTLTIKNDDTTSHLIHSNITGLGFPHQEIAGGGIPPGGTFSAALTSVGAGTIACHSHSHTDTLSVVVP